MFNESTQQGATTILLADDHKMFLEGLDGLLCDRFDVLGMAEDGHQLVELALQTEPDLIITDYSMPGMSGLEAIDKIRSHGLDPRVIVLTMHSDPEYATEAIERHVQGYVLKQGASTELVAAIEETMRGGRWLSPSLAMRVVETGAKASIEPDQRLLKLSQRQREVLRLLVQGRIAKEIAAELHISRKTVEYHKYRMMGDLGVATSSELIALAVKNGVGSGS